MEDMDYVKALKVGLEVVMGRSIQHFMCNALSSFSSFAI